MDDVCITRWISGGYCKQIRSSAWLEHYTDNVGVSSSNLDGSTKTGGLAQLARASALHAEGHRFDSDILHFSKDQLAIGNWQVQRPISNRQLAIVLLNILDVT